MMVAIYPGTFDPITNGHVDIMARAAKLFDELIIAVGTSSVKKTVFDIEKRIRFCVEGTKNMKNVRVVALSGLTAEFAKQNNARYLVRGIRNTDDMNYELSIANMNWQLSMESLETIFLPARDQYRSVSSTIVREIIAHNGDVSAFVPACVVREIDHGA